MNDRLSPLSWLLREPPTMSSDQSSSPGAIFLYVGGIVVTVVAASLGLFLHWTAALTGPGVGLFGIDGWVGAFAGGAVAVAGIWAWRAGGRGVGARTRMAGRLLAVVVFTATTVVADDLLAVSWSVVCDPDRPGLCYQLGVLADDRADSSFYAACTGGRVDGCVRLLDEEIDSTRRRQVCRSGLEYCQRARRCDDQEATEACRVFSKSPGVPMPDPGQCDRLVEHCADADFSADWTDVRPGGTSL